MRRLNHTQQGYSLAIIGFTSACLFALTKIHAPELVTNILALPMALLGFFAIYRYGNDLQIKVPMLFLLIAILIPLISWYFAHLKYPEWVDSSPHLDKVSRLFLFIPIAWWLKEKPKKVFLLWSIAAATILISPWIGGGGWAEIIQGWHGGRVDFDLRNAGHTSLFFGFVLIGLLCFSPRLYLWKKVTLVALIPTILFCFFTMIATQTRAAWLAMVISLITSLLYCVLQKRKYSFSAKKILLVVFAITIMATAAYKTMGTIVEKRSSTESSTIEHILSGDFDNIPYTSIGIRIHLWRAAITRIEERPLLGWGNRGQSIAIDETKWMPEHIKKDFGHLHNVYLSILVDYGLIGLLFYFVWFGWFLFKILSAVSKGFLNRDIGIYTIAVLSFWSVVNLFESYLLFWTGVFCIQILFGGLLGLIWHAKIQENKQKESPQET